MIDERLRRRRGFSGPLPGDGPWRIVDECPALRHNTRSAATGGRKAGVPKCVCPRALDLYGAFLDWRREYDRLRETRPKVITSVDVPGLTPAAVFRRRLTRYTPDLSAGRCRTTSGAAIIRTAQTSVGNAKVNADRAVKWMCGRCRVRLECATWVLAKEGPSPGAWGGVIAGLSPQERRTWHKLHPEPMDSAPNAIKDGAQ